MSDAPRRGDAVSVEVAAGDWAGEPGESAESVARTAARRTLGVAGPAAACEVDIRLTDDGEIRALNRDWRGRDTATNVLSFPLHAEGPPDGPRLLGCVVVACETCRAEAEAEGKPFADHLRHMVVHGILHLLGHDHEDDAAAEAMEALERDILAGLGVADPYGGRAAA